MSIAPSRFGTIAIPYDKVLVRLGYAKGKTKVDEKTKALIEAEISLAQKLIYPKQVVSSSAVDATKPGSITLEPTYTIKSKKIYALLKDSPNAFGFAVTIGPHIEAKRGQYIAAKETTRALIMDAIGSVMAEELAELTHRQIQYDNKIFAEVSMRFSPGYGDWALAGQKDFLRWLGAEQIGIKLTRNFQMLPEKSVSAILGVR